jgi:two-component system, NarL family, invasion response regulator UvrY
MASDQKENNMITVVVVDDHHLIRMGLTRTLEGVPGVTVVGQASTGEEALDVVRQLRPDVVLMDIRMPGIGGVEATRRILSNGHATKVIIITALNDDVHPGKLLKAGAAGYITKNTSAVDINTAIKRVCSGEIYISPAIAQEMMLKKLSPGDDSSPFGLLSERELQIAQMITSGHRAAEVAAILNISAKTINTHKYRIYDKLGVSNDVELTLAAVKYGLVDPNELV